MNPVVLVKNAIVKPVPKWGSRVIIEEPEYKHVITRLNLKFVGLAGEYKASSRAN